MSDSIKTSTSIATLMPALLLARASITPASKSGHNGHQHYNYANEQDWHNAIQPALIANKILLVMSVVATTPLEVRQSNKGSSQFAYQVEGTARVIHESGEWLEACGVGHGQDQGDKGIYKAQTGLKKYLYALLFALPTADDPESTEQAQTRTNNNNNSQGQQDNGRW